MVKLTGRGQFVFNYMYRCVRGRSKGRKGRTMTEEEKTEVAGRDFTVSCMEARTADRKLWFFRLAFGKATNPSKAIRVKHKAIITLSRARKTNNETITTRALSSLSCVKASVDFMRSQTIFVELRNYVESNVISIFSHDCFFVVTSK